MENVQVRGDTGQPAFAEIIEPDFWYNPARDWSCPTVEEALGMETCEVRVIVPP